MSAFCAGPRAMRARGNLAAVHVVAHDRRILGQQLAIVAVFGFHRIEHYVYVRRRDILMEKVAH